MNDPSQRRIAKGRRKSAWSGLHNQKNALVWLLRYEPLLDGCHRFTQHMFSLGRGQTYTLR
jgi:hypothetical protein